jgi:hypothetical protein
MQSGEQTAEAFLTRFLIVAAVLVATSAQAQDAPRIDDQPRRACLEAQRVVFRVENPGPKPLEVTLRVDRWSPDGDTPGWTTFEADITQREAVPRKLQSVTVEARGHKDVTWDLKKRRGPPLVTGSYRLVAAFSSKGGEPLGTREHAFMIEPCER